MQMLIGHGQVPTIMPEASHFMRNTRYCRQTLTIRKNLPGKSALPITAPGKMTGGFLWKRSRRNQHKKPSDGRKEKENRIWI